MTFSDFAHYVEKLKYANFMFDYGQRFLHLQSFWQFGSILYSDIR